MNNTSLTEHSFCAMSWYQGRKNLMQLSLKCVLILLYKFWDKTILRIKDKLEQKLGKKTLPSSCGTQEIFSLKILTEPVFYDDISSCRERWLQNYKQ